MIFIRPDTFVHDDRYPHGSAVTPALVAEAMRAGNTFLVHNLEIYWKPVGVLSEALSTFTNLYVQANLYYSPHGFAATVSPHQDAQSVFIVQLEGTKTWTLFAPRHRLALKKVALDMPPSKTRQVFSLFDEDDTGLISYREFCHASTLPGSNPRPPH